MVEYWAEANDHDGGDNVHNVFVDVGYFAAEPVA